ncbi:hypothetical protein AB1E18_009426 [Capra hircus]
MPRPLSGCKTPGHASAGGGEGDRRRRAAPDPRAVSTSKVAARPPPSRNAPPRPTPRPPSRRFRTPSAPPPPRRPGAPGRSRLCGRTVWARGCHRPPRGRGPGHAPAPAPPAGPRAPILSPEGRRPRARILSASFSPPSAWPPSLSRGPGKRRPHRSRPPGPPDIPGIAAHNCTFPGQERPPRWSSAGPAALTCSRSGRARRAPAPPPSADSPSPRSPPPSVAPALLAAGEGTGPRHVRPIAPSLGPPRPAPLGVQVGKEEGTCHSSPGPPIRVRRERKSAPTLRSNPPSCVVWEHARSSKVMRHSPSAGALDMASISTQRTKEILATGQTVGCSADGCHPHDVIDDINSGAVECPTG